MKELSAFIGAVVISFGLVFYTVFTGAFVLGKLLTWFIYPIFNLPVLTYWQLGGVILFLSAIRSRVNDKLFLKGVQLENKLDYAAVIVLPWLSLFVSWIFKSLFL